MFPKFYYLEPKVSKLKVGTRVGITSWRRIPIGKGLIKILRTIIATNCEIKKGCENEI
jgi:hypothetical protein